MVNKVVLIGNVGADPTIKTVGENNVANFTLATSETYKNKDGERVTNTEWHNIVVWRGLSKVVELYVKKGSQLYVEGKITTRSYEKDGQTKYFTEIVANDIRLIGRKLETDGVQQPVVAPATVTESDMDLTPDGGADLPF